MFVDQIKIHLNSGDGGNGCVSFRREKFIPRGGPNGGDGGNGGNVIIKADKKIKTLIDFYYHPHYKAERGKHGQGKDMAGKRGSNLILRVPLGTVIYDSDSDKLLVDMIEHGKEVFIAKGGRGGRGNARFATSTRQAPKFAEKGKPGEERHLRLELKLIADVGLIGFPNVGKSTLISRITSARPKIAEYPFTTIVPNLGVVNYDDGFSFVVADMPGLISGASKGVGLGDRFLRHIQRTKILLHLVDLSGSEGRDPISDYELIERELELYDISLLGKQQIVVGNKIDLPHAKEAIPKVKEYFKEKKIKFLAISGVSGEGLKNLLKITAQTLTSDL